MASVKLPTEMQGMHKALCVNLHTLVTTPSSRQLYEYIQSHNPEWRKQLHP